MVGSGKRRPEWPQLLDRYVNECKSYTPEYEPRRVRRRFHNMDLTLWQGYLHIDDIEGYVGNIRLTYYLQRWRARRKDPKAVPGTDDMYEIMMEADSLERRESKKPFHVQRIADNIARNGVQEPIIVFADGQGAAELWDGNRRFYGSMHIVRTYDDAAVIESAKWIPAFVISPSGKPDMDARIKHAVITECNFIEKDHIPWPAYVKAEQLCRQYEHLIKDDPNDSRRRKEAKEKCAQDYGLRGWRVADRWIKMYQRAMEFKDYHEGELDRDSVTVDLLIQDKFEYFDELSKPTVWGVLQSDPDARDEVFVWLWDDKFPSFASVRMVPKILKDPVARRQANADDDNAVKRAIATVIANDPIRVKDKEAANEKVKQFAAWLDSFKREDYKQLDQEALADLRDILKDVVAMLEGLLSGDLETSTEHGE